MIEGLENLRIAVFDDEPKVWWWTDSSVLIRGVGAKPKNRSSVPGEPLLAKSARLDVARVRVPLWEECKAELDFKNINVVRDAKHRFFGIQDRYRQIVERWPKPIEWLVPESKKDRFAAALAREVESQQIVAAVMPMSGAEKWGRRK